MESDQKAVTTIVERVATSKCPHCGDEIDVSALEPFSRAECPHCGDHLVVPAKLGPFLLIDAIGEGGMGGVYRAVDQTLGRQVAIKVMLSSLGSDREFVETFKREAQAAAKLNHPHIAQIYSFGEEKGQPYIVMELVDGRGLDKLIESGKRLDQGLIMQIGLDIAEGLSEAEQIGLTHGDIKPENILLDERMNGKLVDFGIASFSEQGDSGGIWGTPYYIAPEKLRRQTIDARSDIYCLGATLFHALAGRPPFEGESPIEVVKARLEHEPPPLGELRSDIDEEIERIIARMLRMDPADRYPTYTSLISDMRKVVQVMKPEREKGGKSKKIRIRKKSTGMTVSAGGPSATTGNIPAVSSKTKSPSSKKRPGKEERIRRHSIVKKIVWASVAVVAVLLLVAGGIFMKIRHDREIEARRLYLALTASRQNAESVYSDIALTVTNIIKRAEPSVHIIDQATNIAAIVTEQSAADLVARLDKESPVFDPAALEAAEKAAAEEEQAKKEAPAPPPEPGTGTNAVEESSETTEADKEETAAKAEGSTNAVPVEAEQETNAVSSATADATNAVVEAAAAADATNAVAGATAAPEPAPEPAVNEPEIRILAMDALAGVLRVRQAVVDARTLGFRAGRLYEQAMVARRPSEVESMVSALTEMLEELEGRKDDITKALDQSSSVLKRMQVIKSRTLRKREEDEKARIAEEKRRQEEEEKRRQEEQHRQQVANEMLRVDEAVEEIKPLLKVHQYDRAMRDLKQRERDLTTDEARDAMQVFVDRYDNLDNLKRFFIKQLNEDPFKWGWIQGTSPEDILGASISHIKLRGRIISWKDVTTRQMVAFIRRYITPNNRSVKLVELGNYALASAIFCYENGGYDYAVDYKEKALRFNSRLKKDADRLVPDAPPADE